MPKMDYYVISTFRGMALSMACDIKLLRFGKKVVDTSLIDEFKRDLYEYMHNPCYIEHSWEDINESMQCAADIFNMLNPAEIPPDLQEYYDFLCEASTHANEWVKE